MRSAETCLLTIPHQEISSISSMFNNKFTEKAKPRAGQELRKLPVHLLWRTFHSPKSLLHVWLRFSVCKYTANIPTCKRRDLE